MMMPTRRFPPPWSVEEGETYFVVKDRSGQKLGFVYFDDGAASVAGASVGYPIRISLTVGLAARICGFEEAYSLFGDNAPMIFADTFGSARRLSPAVQPPAKLASSPPPQSLA